MLDVIAHLEEDISEPTIIGHDDLRPGRNLVFNNNQVTGIIDFGLAQPSTAEREFRHLAFFGDAAVKAAIDRYTDLNPGYKVDQCLIQFWAVTQAVHSCSYSLSANIPTNPLHVTFLKHSFPKLSWEELDAA